MSVKINIITCPQWGAVPPKNEPRICGPAIRIIDHHTGGHQSHAGIPGSEGYALTIQRMHMAPGGLGVPQGGSDSGHNFLVCRNGAILQGRWFTVTAIQHRRMVVSAHCPGQNDQIGIEHEHAGLELMTPEQAESSARLRAWIADQYGMVKVLPSRPHRDFFNTKCPANLTFTAVNKRAQQILDNERARV